MSGSSNVGDGFYVVGFPGGLPMKYADEAMLRSGDNPRFIVVTANTYGGNAGCPRCSMPQINWWRGFWFGAVPISIR